MSETNPQDAQKAAAKDAAWRYGGWVMLVVGCVLFGVGIGFMLWGDAATLRSEVKRLDEQVSSARFERDNMKTQLGRVQRQLESCQATQAP